jgi:hypothetical protein
MGEYAEQYTLDKFGVDISNGSKKKPWKWACPICRKNFASEAALKQHTSMKHNLRSNHDQT